MSEPPINPIAKGLMNRNSNGEAGSSKRKSRGQKPRGFGSWTKFLFITFTVLIAAAIIGAIWLSNYLTPLKEQAERYNLADLHNLEKSSFIFDRHGEELGRIYMLNRTPIKVEQVPAHFIQALTAEEDSRFYQHGGVDIIGIFRAIYLNYKAGAETQGASTLTQQLARQAFNLKEMDTAKDSSRYTRKIVEWFLAYRIEESFKKNEILEFYLNRIYFGAGFYGIQAASQGYFSKDISEISLEESAVLCGLIKSPNNIQPFRNPQRALKARNHVYFRMVQEGMLSEGERLALSEKPIVTKPRETDNRLSYVYEEIRQAAEKIVGEEASQSGGLQIFTTIDAQLQKTAEAAVEEQLKLVEEREDYKHQTYQQYKNLVAEYRKQIANKQLPADTPKPQPEYLQGSALVLDNQDGGILAMVGGRDFIDSMFNRALQAKRPTGTAFVPFVYATAFQSPDYYPMLELEDGPIDNRRVMIGGLTGILGEWGTEKEETVYSPTIRMRNALVESRNAATVRLGERVTLPSVKELVTRAGIKSPMRDYSSSFLGASEATLEEMTLAYTAFANQGFRPNALKLISRITDDQGNVIYQTDDQQNSTVKVMDPIAAYQTHSCLVDALKVGTGKASYEEYGLEEFPAAGKTGTHYEFKDLWFIGYNSNITCGVWTGFDQQKPIYTGAFSHKIVLPIWTKIMNSSIANYPPKEFSEPQDGRFIEICKTSGLRATDACYEKVTDKKGIARAIRSTYKELLRPETNFTNYCTVHSSTNIPRDLITYHSNDESVGNTFQIGALNPNSKPVRMQGLTIIGEDPYNSVQPVVKAEPVTDTGEQIQKAEAVEDASTTENPIRLAPPPPLKIE